MPRGVYKRTEEHKMNMSKAQQKRKERDGYMHSPEARKKISDAMQKRKEELGYIHSPETRKKLSEALAGRKLSEEHKKKLSELAKLRTGEKSSMYGKHHSEESKKKISDAQLGEKSYMYGKTGWNKGLTKETDERVREFGEKMKGRIFSEETKKKMSIARLKRKQELGYVNSPEARKKTSDAMQKRKQELGYINSPETRKKLSEIWNKPGYRENHSGKNHPNWNPNREEVYMPYGENFYNQKIRNDKWDLQNGRDMLTGTMLDPNKKPAYHHIDYCKSNDDPDNLCFLSINNHMRITINQQNPIKSERYKKKLQANILALKNGEIPKHWSQINKELFRQEKLKQLDLSLYI